MLWVTEITSEAVDRFGDKRHESTLGSGAGPASCKQDWPMAWPRVPDHADDVQPGFLSRIWAWLGLTRDDAKQAGR